MINVLPNGLRAQYVRIYPKTHMGATAMRVELYKFSSCAESRYSLVHFCHHSRDHIYLSRVTLRYDVMLCYVMLCYVIIIYFYLYYVFTVVIIIIYAI